MLYNAHSDLRNFCFDENVKPPNSIREKLLYSVFSEVFVNGIKIDNEILILTYEKEHTISHNNRLHICYAKYLKYKNKSNNDTYLAIERTLNIKHGGCWFVNEINIIKQKQIHLSVVVVDSNKEVVYESSDERNEKWNSLIVGTTF